VQDMVVELFMEFFPVIHFCLIASFQEPSTLRICFSRRGGQAPVFDTLTMPFNIDETTHWDEVVATDEWNHYFDNREEIKVLQTSFVPLIVQKAEIGFLMIGRPKETEYGKDEWRFLRTISNYCAMTIDNTKLYSLAITDPLTGLNNRRYFLSRLEREMERAAQKNEPVSVMIIDIDHFKRVNDTWGHPSGDQVLKELALRLNEQKDERSLCFRIGGEEFAILISGADKDSAREKAENFRKAVSITPFVFSSDGKEISKTITISVGLAVYPEDAEQVDTIIAKADQALYLAKTGGRNKVVFHR